MTIALLSGVLIACVVQGLRSNASGGPAARPTATALPAEGTGGASSGASSAFAQRAPAPGGSARAAAAPVEGEPEIPRDPPQDEPEQGELRTYLQNETIQARLDRIERERLARGRFDRAIAEGGYSAARVHPSVRGLFRSMELEPVLDEGGMLAGLEIQSLEPGSPLLHAGFLPTDHITRINETPLRDPAQLPGLLVSLGRQVRMCVDRSGEEICGSVTLD